MPRHRSPQQVPGSPDAAPRPPPTPDDQALLDPYKVLQIGRQAGADEIKKAYFEQVRRFPPEREPVQFKRIRAAYDAIRTPEARAATDLFLLHPPDPYEPYKRPPAFDLAFHPEDRDQLIEAYSDLSQVDFRSDYREIAI